MSTNPQETKYEDATFVPGFLKSLFDNRTDDKNTALPTDVTFLTGPNKTPVKAHKFVLLLTSEYFKSMFTSGMREQNLNAISKENVRKDVMTEILRFLYIGTVMLSPANVMEVHEAAKEMGIKPILKFCLEFVEKSMNSANSIRYFDQSIAFHNLEVQQSSLKFIEANTKQCVKESNFNQISKPTLQVMLESDGLVIPEDELFNAIVSWGKAQANSSTKGLKDILSDVIPLIRFPMTSPEFIFKVVKPLNVVPLEILYEAHEFFTLPDQFTSESSSRTRPRQGSVPIPRSASQHFSTSQLLSTQHHSTLNSWCGKSTSRSWNLLYRASRDGFRASDFHRTCDNKGETLVIIKSTSGCLFGGYTPLQWNQGTNYYIGDSSNRTFIFSLTNTRGSSPTKFPQKDASHSIYSYASRGPTFGGGHDINIADSSNSNTSSYSNFPHTFDAQNISDPNTYLAGSYNFTVSDIEVFTVA